MSEITRAGMPRARRMLASRGTLGSRRMLRSRRLPSAVEHGRTLYARVLRLRHIDPGGVLCFLFLEGAIALAVLLALAEQVSWWAVAVLPLTVAAMVKLNDVIAGALAGPTGRAGRSQKRDRPDQHGSGRVG